VNRLLARRSLLAGGLTALAPAPAPAQVAGWRLGQTIPEFGFRDPFGQRFALASFPGKALLLLFWATWSRDCDAELIKLDAAAQVWKEDPRAAVLTLVIAEPATRARGWLDRRRLGLPVFEPEVVETWDLKLADGRTARMGNAVPFGFILDHQRTLRFQRQGPGGVAAYDEQLRRIAIGVRSFG
jgi:peroxiredoxin